MSINNSVNQSQVQGQQNGIQGPSEGKSGDTVVTSSNKPIVNSQILNKSTNLRNKVTNMKVLSQAARGSVSSEKTQIETTAKSEVDAAKTQLASFGLFSKFLSILIKSIAQQITEAKNNLKEAQSKHENLKTPEEDVKLSKLDSIFAKINMLTNTIDRLDEAGNNEDKIVVIKDIKKEINQVINDIGDIGTVAKNLKSAAEDFNETIDSAIHQFEELAKLAGDKEKLQSELNTKTTELVGKQSNLDELNKKNEPSIKYNNSVKDIKKELRFELELSVSQTTIDTAQKEIATLKLEIEKKRQELSDIDSTIRQKDSEISELTKQLTLETNKTL